MSPRRVFLFRHPTADQRRRERADEGQTRLTLYPTVHRDALRRRSVSPGLPNRYGECSCLLDDEGLEAA
jgi:hypothetical protein